MERAVAYIRVSHIRQVTDGNSLETQERQVRDFAAVQGYELVRIFVERGESAKTDDRTVLKEMLSYLRQPGCSVQVLIIPRIDRLARNVLDYAKLKLEVKSLGIRLESINENLEDTPGGRFTETILASAAQFDNELRAERSKGGMMQAVTDGRWVWKAPFGYRNVRIGADGKKRGIGTIEPDPRHAPVVREVFERLASGRHTPAQVHRWLRSQYSISKTRFHLMIFSPVYIGCIEAFGGRYRATPPFVPLVSEGIFLAAQAGFRRSRNGEKGRYQKDHPDFPLKGTLRCRCGKFMTANWSRGKSGKLHGHYRCLRCRNMNVRKDRIEDLFAAQLRLFALLRPKLNSFEQIFRSLAKSSEDSRHESIRRLLDEQRHISELQSRMALKVSEGVVPDGIAKSHFAKFEKRLQEIALSISEDKSIPGDIDSVMQFADTVLADLPYRWQRSSITTQKKLQHVFFPEGIQIETRDSFRTPGNSPSERILGWLISSNLSLVHHSNESSNTDEVSQLLAWFVTIKSELEKLD